MSDNKTPAQRIDDVIRSKHIQRKYVSESIGVSASTFSTWLNRGGDFPASYLAGIAKALDTDPYWLITGEEHAGTPAPVESVSLTEEEQFLIDMYRGLDREGRIIVSNEAVTEMRRMRAEQGSAGIVTA